MKTMQERIWEKVIPVPESGCWLWTGATFNHGRPQLRMGNRVVLAARQAYLAFRGQEPGDLCVCHKCDTPGCINPAHLSVGSQRDNILDMHAKGRQHSNAGSRHGLHKVTEADVRLIRSRGRAGESSHSIARDFPIAASTIRGILSGKEWRHVA